VQMTNVVFLDTFTSLDELKPKERKNPLLVLRILARAQRFSVFDMVSSPTLQKTMKHLFNEGLLEEVSDGLYPWCKVKLTDKGQSFLSEGKVPDASPRQ